MVSNALDLAELAESTKAILLVMKSLEAHGRAALTYNEAADYLRISRRTLEAIVAAGDIRPAQVSPARIVFRRETLDKYLLRQESAS